jgi:hypothetical protein
MHLKGEELPVFLQSIQAASLVCVQSKLFKIIIHVLLELLLQSITVESEEAFHAIVVFSCSILLCKLHELQIHGTIEVCPQEVRPKAK